MSPLLLVGILVITSAYADVKHVLEGSAHPPDPNSISPQAVNRLSTPYWWMDANSPLKAAYDYYKKCTAKNNCVSPVDPAGPAPQPFIPSSPVSAAPQTVAVAPISIKGNPFLNGDFNPQAGNANYNDKEVKIDIKKNPFLSGAVVTAGNGSPVVKDQNGFLGVQPAQPFGKKPGFATTHPLEKNKKPGFATTHPSKGQNYVNVTVACKGAGFACVEKRLCLNGVVNTNGEGLLQVRSDVRYCHEDTEVCCQMNNLNEITAGKTSTIKFAGGSGFSPGLIHVQPQEPLKPEIIFGGENGHHSSSTSKSIRDTSLSPNSVFSSTVDYSDVQFANDVRFASTFQGPAYLPPIGPTTPAPRPFETKQPSINQQYVPSRPSTAQYLPPSPTTQRPAPSTPKYIPPSPTTPRPVPTFRPVTTSTYRPAPSTTTYRPAPPVTFRPAPSTTFRPAPPVTFRPAPSTTFRPAPPVTFKPAPTTSREYLPPRPSAPRPSNTNNQYVPPYQPSVTPQKPYQPSVTPQKPYQPSFTTQQPYRPSVTPQRPYQPSVTPQRPYQPSVTPQKPYQPSVTPQQPYQPSITPQKPYQPSVTPQQPYRPAITTQRPYQPSITPQKPYQPSVTPQRPYQPSITPQRPYQPSTSRPTTSREYLPPRTSAPFVPQPSSPRPNPFFTQPTTPRPTYQQQTRPTPSYKYPSPSGPSTFPQPRPTPGPSYSPATFPQPRPTPGPSYPQPRPTPGPSFTQPRPTFTQPRPTPGPSYPQPRPTPGPSFTQPRPTPGPSYPQPRPTPGPSFTQPRPAFTQPRPTPGPSYSPATFPQPRPTQRPQPSGPTQGYQYPTPRPQTRPTPPPFRPTPSIPQFTPPQPRPTSPPVNTGYQYPTPHPPFPSPSPQPRPTPRPQFPSPAQPRPSIPQFPSPSPQPRPTPRPQFPSPSPPQPRPSIPQFPSPSSPQPRPTPPPVTPGYQYPTPQPSFPSLRPSIPQFPSPSPPQPRPIPQFPSPQPRPTPRPQFPTPSPPQPRPVPQFPSPQPRPTPRPQFPTPSPPQPRPIPQFPSPSTPQPRPTPPPVNTGYQYPTPQQPFPNPSPQPRPTPRPQFPSPTPPQPRPSENTPGYQFPTPSSPRPNPFIPQQSTPSRPVTSPPFSPSTNYIQPSTPSRPAPSLRPYEPSTPKPFVPQPTPAPNPAGGYEYPKPTPTFGYPSTSRPVFGNSNVNNQYIPPPRKPSENPDQSVEAANVDGAFIRPTTARTQFQGELNTAPPPGCAAALKCVQEIYCSAEGVISPVPVVLTKEQELSRVPTTVCQDTESGIIGKCCRDPNYKDPWPSANLVDGVDDGQYKEDNNFGQYQQDLQRPVRSDKGGPRQDLSNNRNTNFQVPQPTCGERHVNSKPPGPGPLDANFAEIPWQAMVLRDSNRSLLCGGAIIRKNAVLTAAHCVEGLETSDILVKGGEWKLGIDEEPLPFQIVKVAAVVRHPQYQKGSFVNDLAVLILEEKLRPAKNIGTLCLPAPNQIPTENCIATGWGKRILQLHAKGAIMHAIDVKIMDNQQCQDTLAGTFQHASSNYSPNTLCGYSDIDQCKVDYGSALACSDGNRFILSGIYAWDTGCKQPGQIGGYIAPDVDWIESTLAKPVRELKQLERN